MYVPTWFPSLPPVSASKTKISLKSGGGWLHVGASHLLSVPVEYHVRRWQGIDVAEPHLFLAQGHIQPRHLKPCPQIVHCLLRRAGERGSGKQNQAVRATRRGRLRRQGSSLIPKMTRPCKTKGRIARDGDPGEEGCATRPAVKSCTAA